MAESVFICTHTGGVMDRRYRTTKYLVHICTAANCRAYANTEGMAEYIKHGDTGYHGAFVGFIEFEGTEYARMKPGERIHVVHVDKTHYRTLGERYYWNKPA
jgi:hypothetical protein